ncbi:MAG: DUF1887 family protein [Paludibacteraceae bacterium]|nr:DUF1887 family protein [Paludibacteraceae bacterium]
MKVHITLVGGQPAPVYHGIVATNPDRVVYVYSVGSQSVLDTLKKEIDIPCDDVPPLSPTDPQEIVLLAERLAKKYEKEEVTVNISSGLKSWSHLFGRVFDNCPNASVVYMDQNNVLWNYRSMEKQEGFLFDMHTLFRLYGNSIENNYKRFSDYTGDDEGVISDIEQMRSFNNRDFNALTTVLDQQKQTVLRTQPYGRFDLLRTSNSSYSYVEWQKTTTEEVGFVRLCLYKKNGICKEVVLESPHVVDLVFNSGWFEYKVALMLSKWDRSKEICMNCHFPYKPKVDKNETDIIVNTGTKLLFVECKTQITHTTDIDKFRSVVKAYGGMGSKALFVTDAPMSEIAQKKCEENSIIPFSLQDSHLGMSSESALFLLLNTELFNINTK